MKLIMSCFVSLILLSCIGSGDEPWTETFLSTIDTNGDNLQHLVKDIYGKPKFSYNGEKIIIANNQGFWTANSDGSDYELIVDTLISYNNYFSVSPTDDYITFTNSGNIYKCNYIMNHLEIIYTDLEEYAWLHSYSPDGSKILFSTSESQADSTIVKVYSMNEDGTNQALLYSHTSSSSTNIKYPIYSQNMEKVFFVYGGLIMCNPDGSELELIYSDNISDSPLITANNFIVFKSGGDIISCNYVTSLISNLGDGQYPDISPDGLRVTFYDYNLMIMDIDGSSRNKIAESSNSSQSFSNDGERIVFLGDINHSSKRKTNPLN